MSTTVNVVCYKSKVLSNNESPLMLRVTKDRKRKYVSLGISVNPEHWDFSKNQPKSDCPNREFIELMIAEKLKAYNSTIIELKATNQDFTSSSLVDKVDGGNSLVYKETFKVLLLNNANKIIGYTTISDGGLTSTIVDVRVIIQTALVCNATSIIITHNHPSGNPRPSGQDDSLTKKIKAACELMDIRILDHIIVTPYDSFYYYCDEGRL